MLQGHRTHCRDKMEAHRTRHSDGRDHAMGNAGLAQRGCPRRPGAAPKSNLSCSRDGAKGGCWGIVRWTLARPRDGA